MEWFRGTMLKDIPNIDYRTYMKIPWLNRLEKTWVLPEEFEGYMKEKTIEYMDMWRSVNKFDVYPWDWKKEYYLEDMNVLDIFDKIAQDYSKLQGKMSDIKQAESKYISDNILSGKKKYGW